MSNDESVRDALDNTNERNPHPSAESNNMDNDDHDGRNEATEQDLDNANYDKFGDGTDGKNRNEMDDKPKLDHSPSTVRIPSMLDDLPNELLIKIIEHLPQTQWPALESIDRKFRDATMLAWESVRDVDVERDFMHSESRIVIGNIDRLRNRIVRNMESILKKLNERSPKITSLSGVSFSVDDPHVNATIIQRLSEFRHLESIKFAIGRIPLDDLSESIESTRSRATLNEIITVGCVIPVDAHHYERLRAAFGNNPNDPSREPLKLESLALDLDFCCERSRPLGYYLSYFNFIDTIDTSRLTKLSFGSFPIIEPAILATLINRAPELRHLDFSFVPSCDFLDEEPFFDEGEVGGFASQCQSERLEANNLLMAALESSHHLTSLEIHPINSESGGDYDCACNGFETAFLKMLKTIGPRLEKFSFEPGYLPINTRDCVGEVFEIIQRHMPRLKSIKLIGDIDVSTADLRNIADYKELEEVVIDIYYVHSTTVHDDVDVLPTIIGKSIHLKRFIVHRYRPNQRGVSELCKLSELVELEINASSLTSADLVAFSQAFASTMEVLCLHDLKNEAESGLIEFVSSAHQLRELKLIGGCATDRLFKCMADSCPNLEEIGVLRSSSITIGDIQMLVDRCPKLQRLDLTYKGSVLLEESLKCLKIDKYRKPLRLEFSRR